MVFPMPKHKIVLTEDEVPKQWYCINPDLPEPLPPSIDPQTREPAKPDVLVPVFGMELLKQEMSQERYIDIPEEVQEAYRLWRPTPLYRAINLEKSLKTPAKIYYKYEGVSPSGSHKPNTAVPQVFYNMKEGRERLTTETGAGQWGSALAFACSYFNVKSTVYMVRASYDQKPYRRVMMETWGAEVYSSPSKQTESGRKILKEDPDNSGSLGIAISEAVEDAITHEEAKYTIGSVLGHVLTHQTVIGQETKKQLESIEDYPDMIVGCIGGGSSYSGLYWPFYHDTVSGKAPKDIEFLATESTACPKVTKGYYTYDHPDTAHVLQFLVKMHTIGHTFIPPPIHAGGLRYHGMAPTLCLLKKNGIVKTKAYNQVDVFEAGMLFAKTEGIIPAPEPMHAIKGIIDEAIRCKETGEKKTLLFLLCGHGHFDMQGYDDYLSGKLLPYEYPQRKVDEAMHKLVKMYPWLKDDIKNFK